MRKKEIATPERFSVQARNDKIVDCFVASLLAMTVVAIVIASFPLGGVAISSLSVIARLPAREAVAIS